MTTETILPWDQGTERWQRSQRYAIDPARLKRHRKDIAKLTALELADKAGLSHAMVSHLESGRRQPSIVTLRKLCEALQCSPDDLV